MIANLLKYIVVLSVFAFPLFVRANVCNFLEQSVMVKAYLSFSKKVITPPWQQFSLSNYPIVLTELTKNQSCGVLVRNGEIETLLYSSKKIKLANNAYTYLRNGKSQDSELGDIPSELSGRGIQAALVWNFDFSWPPVVPLGLQMGIMVHEGFHLFGQHGDSAWPEWPTNRGQFSSATVRNELVQKCYNGNTEVSNLADIELQILETASRAALEGDRVAARDGINKFIQTRVSRYKLLRDSKVRINDQSWMSCPDIEASFEFNEGIPDYVMYATILKSKQIDFNSLIAFIRSQYQPSQLRESYYAFGGLQMLILSMMDENFFEIQQSLLNSKQPSEGVFPKFQQFQRGMNLLSN